MKGFLTLNNDEKEMMSSFIDGELYFPFYNRARFKASPHIILTSLIKKGLIIRGRPYRLSRKGIDTLTTIKEKS